MVISDDQYKILRGMLIAWKQLPSLLVEVVAIIGVSWLGIPWAIGLSFAAAAPLSFFKFGLTNNALMILGFWLKWPVRIAALYFLGLHAHAPNTVIFLIFMFFYGAKLALIPWNALFDPLIVRYSTDGQLLEYAATELLGERCLKLPLFSNPLMRIPVTLPNGKSFSRLSDALVDATNIKDTDPLMYSMIVVEATKILGREHLEILLKAFGEREREYDLV